MSNGQTTSQPATPVTHGPANVTEGLAQQAIEEAKKKGQELVQDLTNVVLQQQAPPGTPKLGKK